MILNKFRKYATDPLYRYNDVQPLNHYIVFNNRLTDCENRIIEILSFGEPQQLHQYMDRFPWQEMEELLGEHLQTAISMTTKKTKWANELNVSYVPNIFDRYLIHHRMDYML